jgi:sporulation protein YlmC with PRC-barrel domain
MQLFVRDGLETELLDVEEEIKTKEVEIMEIEPGLDILRNQEAAERKQYAIPMNSARTIAHRLLIISKARRIEIPPRCIVCKAGAAYTVSYQS